MKSVDRILKGFTKTVAQLNKAVQINGEAATLALGRADEARRQAVEYNKEAERAANVAKRLEALLNGDA